MTGLVSVFIVLEEDQVARLRNIVSCAYISAEGAHVITESLAARIPGINALGNVRIVQAEGDEHGAPVLVLHAIPVAVAGVALHIALGIDDEVAGALVIADLGACDGQDILAPIAGQLHVLEGGLPLGRGFAVIGGNPALRTVGRSVVQGIRNRHGKGGRAIDRRRADARAACGFQHGLIFRSGTVAVGEGGLHAVRRKTAADGDGRADALTRKGAGLIGLHGHDQLVNLGNRRGLLGGLSGGSLGGLCSGSLGGLCGGLCSGLSGGLCSGLCGGLCGGLCSGLSGGLRRGSRGYLFFFLGFLLFLTLLGR